MSKLRILLTDVAWPDTNIEQSLCANADCELVIAPSTDESILTELAENADAIVTCWANVTASVIAATQGRCQVVSRLGIGLDNIDVNYCTQHQIPVTNIPDYCLQEVAEHAIASIFTLGRQLSTFHLRTKNNDYQREVEPPIRRIHGQTLGIIGLGNIGQRVASLANAVGLNVVGTRRNMTPAIAGVRLTNFAEALNISDFVSLHLPLTPDTQHILGEPQFAAMKDSAFLINTARGGLVDHAALAAALESKQIAGAALDVQDPEPPDLTIPPYNDPRVIVTPHTAFISAESITDLRTRCFENTLSILSGSPGKYVVNL
jgi:D-3-phosphoglycerate dehydrogenase